ncbi:hypothetical protein FS842_006522 [Serendipita sp. 407]|nr:hypothetical protein FS842_006522 [Serendipita sp. 407]
MFKHAILAVSALLTIATVPVTAQCTNGACTAANDIYTQCQLSTTTTAAFKTCLCTQIFLVNYGRCLNGVVCAWDGNPSTLGGVCVDLYCPGTFDGGFDATAYCSTGGPHLPTPA